MIKDKNIDWLRASYIIEPSRFGPGVIPSGTDAAGGKLEGYDAGAPQSLEFSSFGYGSLSIYAAGDAFSCLDFQFPRLFDPEHEIGVRVLWGVVGTVELTDAVHWLVKYDQADINEVLVAPTGTALNTVIPIQSPDVVTTVRWYRTARGKINARVMDMAARNGVIGWYVEADVLTAFAPDEVRFLGLELDYIPLLCSNGTEDRSYRQRLAAD